MTCIPSGITLLEIQTIADQRDAALTCVVELERENENAHEACTVLHAKIAELEEEIQNIQVDRDQYQAKYRGILPERDRYREALTKMFRLCNRNPFPTPEETLSWVEARDRSVC